MRKIGAFIVAGLLGALLVEALWIGYPLFFAGTGTERSAITCRRQLFFANMLGTPVNCYISLPPSGLYARVNADPRTIEPGKSCPRTLVVSAAHDPESNCRLCTTGVQISCP